MGFIVAGAIIVLYLVLILGAINIAKNAIDKEGAYIAIGIARLICISYD